MRILITGGNGFMGNAIWKYLQNKYDYEIFAPSSSELDISNEVALDSFIIEKKPDYIIHLANKGGGRDTIGLQNIVEYNLRIFFNVAKQSGRVKKIISFGSGAEYSKHKPITKAKESSYKDAMPLDSYGFYKYVTSHFIETSSNIMCLRIFGCYGVGENYRYKFISNSIVKNLLHLPITIYQDCLFDYIYIDDLVRIVDYFLHHTNTHKIYNASSGNSVLLSDLASMINAASTYKSRIVTIRNNLNNEYTSDNSRILAEIPHFNFTPHFQAITQMRKIFIDNMHMLDIESVRQDPYLQSISTMWQPNNVLESSLTSSISLDQNRGGGGYSKALNYPQDFLIFIAFIFFVISTISRDRYFVRDFICLTKIANIKILYHKFLLLYFLLYCQKR